MGKTLKLGFAMGGGVSLGSFSGAALTETIKLALLYGTDKDGNPYENVVVDVFSGASAGAMSLGVMLRALAFPAKDTVVRQAAWKKLATDYEIDTASWTDQKRKEQLIDAELAQQKMNKIWTEEITLVKFLEPEEEGFPPLIKQAGILNKAAVTNIAKEYLFPDNGESYNEQDKATHPVLAGRVLYSCSISNLNPIIANVDAKYLKAVSDDEQPDLASADALTSKFHQEHRIFDINFGSVSNDKFSDTDIHPKRWVRFHWGDNIDNVAFDIRARKDWRHIVATAIASGAFPAAFEPVSLRRWQWEYPAGLWIDSSVSSYVYTYVDGGTFANSPVTEAFKLASHIDSISHLNDNAPFERRIIFVDPFVGEEITYNLPHLKSFRDQKPLSLVSTFDGNDLLSLTSLDKLLPAGKSLLGAIHSQASSQQHHRNFQIANKLKMRNELRDMLAKGVVATEQEFLDLRDKLGILLSQFSNKALIPTLSASVANEIERLAREPGSLVSALEEHGKEIATSTWDVITGKGLEHVAMQAMLFSYIDLIADLEAKSRNSQLISIAPLDFDDNNEIKKMIFLPGSPLAGFAGFMSELPSKYEVKVARYCSFIKLRESLLLPKTLAPTRANTHPGEFTDKVAFDEEYKGGLKKFAYRVGELVSTSNFINLGWANDVVLTFIKSRIEKAINELSYVNKKTEYEFRVRVDNKKFELDGKGVADNDRHPVMLSEDAKELYLICFAERDWAIDESETAALKWSGYYIENGELGIDFDSWASINDNYFVQIPMPSDKQLTDAAKIANPIFYTKDVLKKDSKPSTNALNAFWELRNDVTPYTDLL